MMRTYFSKSLALTVLLLFGCDASDTDTTFDCKNSRIEQMTSPRRAYQDACALGHSNSVSTEREW